MWRDLVCGQWHTDVTVKTDANGHAKLRGFYGRYDVTVKSDRASNVLSVLLDKDASREVKLILEQ